MVQARQMRIKCWSAALLTGAVGLINLASAVTPSLPDRVQLLREFIPFEIRSGGHLFSALTGFFLLALATNLLRRKRVAWLLTLGLLAISILSHLIKGLDYEEGLISISVLVYLLLIRQVFTARSDPPSIAQGTRSFIAALLFTLVYGTLGFFVLDRHYSVNFSLIAALEQTLAMFFTADNGGLYPTTRFGQFFADSIETIGAVTFGYALFMLMRPVLLQATATDAERQQAAIIVATYGASSLSHFTLLPDKFYYFSPSRQSVIAYVAKGRGAIALGDPIGPEQDQRAAIVGFQQFCSHNDWYPAFYQTRPDTLDLYQSLDFRALQIGQEAIVDLTTFTLEGKAGKNLRTVVNKLTRLGHTVQWYTPPIGKPLLQELRAISDEWLQLMHGSEKRFSLGWFDESYLRSCEIAAIHTSTGQISAFANIPPTHQSKDATVDLMRRRADIENGTMDFLFISLFQQFKARGYKGFNLGLSALAGVGETQQASRLEKGVHYLYEHLNQFYNFKGIHSYKDKFHPCWQPRYLIYPNLAALPDVVVALVRADSGDRLLDYFKPGT